MDLNEASTAVPELSLHHPIHSFPCVRSWLRWIGADFDMHTHSCEVGRKTEAQTKTEGTGSPWLASQSVPGICLEVGTIAQA